MNQDFNAIPILTKQKMTTKNNFITEEDLPMNYYTNLDLKRDNVIRGLEENFKTQRKHWYNYFGCLPDEILYQPSYRPHYMKPSKGKDLLILSDEDSINKSNWEELPIHVRCDFIDCFWQYDLYIEDTINIVDEYDKKEKNDKKILKNALSQVDISNYLLLHENKQPLDDVSNHIISFL